MSWLEAQVDEDNQSTHALLLAQTLAPSFSFVLILAANVDAIKYLRTLLS